MNIKSMSIDSQILFAKILGQLTHENLFDLIHVKDKRQGNSSPENII